MRDDNQVVAVGGEPSTLSEREVLRARLRHEARPLQMSSREVLVLIDMLSMAEAAIVGAGLKDLPK